MKLLYVLWVELAKMVPLCHTTYAYTERYRFVLNKKCHRRWLGWDLVAQCQALAPFPAARERAKSPGIEPRGN